MDAGLSPYHDEERATATRSSRRIMPPTLRRWATRVDRGVIPQTGYGRRPDRL